MISIRGIGRCGWVKATEAGIDVSVGVVQVTEIPGRGGW